MMTTAEQIYTLVKTLPQAQAAEVLTFVESIRTKIFNAGGALISPIAPNVSQSVSFRSALKGLHNLTDDLPAVDPVALIRAGREELDERGGV